MRGTGTEPMPDSRDLQACGVERQRGSGAHAGPGRAGAGGLSSSRRPVRLAGQGDLLCQSETTSRRGPRGGRKGGVGRRGRAGAAHLPRKHAPRRPFPGARSPTVRSCAPPSSSPLKVAGKVRGMTMPAFPTRTPAQPGAMPQPTPSNASVAGPRRCRGAGAAAPYGMAREGRAGGAPERSAKAARRRARPRPRAEATGRLSTGRLRRKPPRRFRRRQSRRRRAAASRGHPLRTRPPPARSRRRTARGRRRSGRRRRRSAP